VCAASSRGAVAEALAYTSESNSSKSPVRIISCGRRCAMALGERGELACRDRSRRMTVLRFGADGIFVHESVLSVDASCATQGQQWRSRWPAAGGGRVVIYRAAPAACLRRPAYS